MAHLRASARHRLIGGGATAALVGVSALHLVAASAGDEPLPSGVAPLALRGSAQELTIRPGTTAAGTSIVVPEPEARDVLADLADGALTP